jgi:uncharacterized protein
MQPTRFCNIDCSYCYLPNRGDKSKMSMGTFRQTLVNLIESDLIGESLEIAWHAGEPLVAPLQFYKDATKIVKELFPEIRFTQTIQTNAILINQEWCDFFNEEKINLGVSLDGPQFVHDKFRLTRKGKGTFENVIKGIRLLQNANVEFSIISVISSESLDFAEEIYKFFIDLKIEDLGFNVEEVEGINTETSFHEENDFERIRMFFEQFHELNQKHNSALRIREFHLAKKIIVHSASGGQIRNDLSDPLAIINVGFNGNFSTYSPELVDQVHEKYGDFIFGNVHEDSFLDILKNEKFKNINDSIKKGVQICKETCEYFEFCGGGSPSNKLWENGTFECSETQYCNFSIKIPTDIILPDLEKEYEVV